MSYTLDSTDARLASFLLMRKRFWEVNLNALECIIFAMLSQHPYQDPTSPLLTYTFKYACNQAIMQVDIEINGFPVEINMKLDDTGAAFFVEEIEDGEEDDDWSANLATSPLPNLTLDWAERRNGNLKPNTLFQSETDLEKTATQQEDEVLARVLAETTSNLIEQDEGEEEDEDETPDNSRVEDHVGRKGKLNKKKRKRRRDLRSRRGSKSNILLREIQTENETGDELFAMDDVIDLEQDSALTPELPLSSQRSPRHLSAPSNDFNDVDPHLEPLQAVFVEEACNQDGLLTRTMSVKADFHFFPEMRLSDEQEALLQPKPDTAPLTETLVPEAADQPDLNVWRWGEPVMEVQQAVPKEEPVVVQVEPEPTTKSTDVEVKEEEEEKQSSWLGLFRGSRSSQPRDDAGGVYLDDIVNDPEKRALYLKPSPAPLEVCVGPTDPLDLSHIPRSGIDMPRDFDCESGNGPSLPMSPQTIPVSSKPSGPSPSTKDLAALVSQHLPDLAVSLCGGLEDKSITPSQFNSGLLTYTQFLERLKESSPVLADPNLVVRLEEKYVSWTTASPILLSLMFFKKPLPKETIEDILKDGLPVNLNLSAEEATMQKSPKKDSTGWFGWFGSSSEQQNESEVIKEVLHESEIKTEPEEDTGLTLAIPNPGTPRKRLETENTSSDSDLGDKRRWKKTLRLTSEQLASLNLEKGGNEVEFSVTTQFQGTTRAQCTIYLWHHTDKVVISDIDGTITKSDVLGHVLPMVGRDWAQSGVAELFSKIRANGYHIMYLSARAIGQASMTHEYLESVRQGEVYLPEGPVFLNPDSLIHAFKREVIDKNPEEFKIRCLKDIQNLFEGKNPFFAGYGNKPNVSAKPQGYSSAFNYIFLSGCICVSGCWNPSFSDLHNQSSRRTQA